MGPTSVSSVTGISSVMLPPPQFGYDRRFYAPPPSAARLVVIYMEPYLAYQLKLFLSVWFLVCPPMASQNLLCWKNELVVVPQLLLFLPEVGIEISLFRKEGTEGEKLGEIQKRIKVIKLGPVKVMEIMAKKIHSIQLLHLIHDLFFKPHRIFDNFIFTVHIYSTMGITVSYLNLTG